MVFKPVGNSGFEYEITSPSQWGHKMVVRNIQTGIQLFMIQNKLRVTTPPAVSKTFLGLDNKYYFVNVGVNRRDLKTMVGQVTPSGAIVDVNTRTIIHHINFFPFYNEGISKTPEPVKIVPKTPQPIKTVIDHPITTLLTTIPDIKTSVNETWIMKINKLMDQIILMINNLLKRLKL